MNLSALSQQALLLANQIQKNISFLSGIIIAVFLFNLLNWALGSFLNRFGLLPRNLFGLIGIITAPVLHGNFTHFLLNAILFFVLANMILIGGHDLFYQLTVFVVLAGGWLTWLFGRRALHIGASGLNMGYWAFLLVRAYREPGLISIAIAFVCLYYFGGLAFDLFPRQERVSWEGHLFGFLAGLVYGIWL